MVKERSSSQSRVPAVQGHFAGDSAETLLLFRNKVEKQLLQDFVGYDPKRKNGRYVERSIMRTARLDSWMVTVIRCLAENKKHGSYRRKEHADTHGGMVEAATK